MGLLRSRGARRGVDPSRARGRTRNPAETLLSGAVLWLDASKSDFSTSNVMTNRGTGGSVLNAQFGSTGTSDTNDPLLLAHTGVNYLYLPGVAGNYASAPDSVPLSVTGDIEIVMRVALDDWTPTTTSTLICKRETVAGLSFQLAMPGGSATSQMAWSFNDGVTDFFLDGTVVPPAPFADGTVVWLKFTRVAATGAIQMQSAPDQATEPTTWPTTWTSSGTRTAGNIKDTASSLEIGSNRIGSAEPAQAKFYRAIVRNGIGGTTVFDADFTTKITSGGQTSFTESSSNAATVTINRSTSGRKAVAVVRPVLLFGTDDYLEVADNALLNFTLTDDFTALVVARQFATPPSNTRYIAKGNTGSANSWMVWNNGTTQGVQFRVDGTTLNSTSATTGPVAGTLKVAAGVHVGGGSPTVQAYANNTTLGSSADTTTGTFSNALPLRIGTDSAGLSFNDFEFVAAALFRRALSAADIATIVSYYGAA